MTSVAQPVDSNTHPSDSLNEFEAGDYVVLQHKGDEEVIPGDFSTTSPSPPPSAPSSASLTAPPPPPAATTVEAEASPPAVASEPAQSEAFAAENGEEEDEEQERDQDDEEEQEEEYGDNEEEDEEYEENSVVDSAIEETTDESDIESVESETAAPSKESNEAASLEPLPADSVNPPTQSSRDKPKAMTVESMLIVGSLIIALMAFLLYRWIPAATPTQMPYRYESDDFVGAYSARIPARN